MVPALPHHPLSAAPRAAGPPADGPGAAATDGARAGLYVHVPFCAKRCAYCQFSSGSLSAAAVERFLAALDIEMASRAAQAASLEFHSVFFGGGTPSALSSRHLKRIAGGLRAHFRIAPSAEITLEANPESARPALLSAWREAGVNRLSMGVQSFIPAELSRLGRIHDAGRPARAFAEARAAGFERLSLDLMFGYPGHTLAAWRESLERALELEPEHLSAYCFIPEAGTPMGDDVLAGRVSLPSPEEQADAYAWLGARTGAASMRCYETSNFCLPDAECRHNLVYWLRRPYLGLGPSAHGFVDGVREANPFSLEGWAESLERRGIPGATRERVDEATAADEIVMLGLRLGRGLDLADHPAHLRDAVRRRHGAALRAAVTTGRLCGGGDSYRVAPAHRFLADDIIAWVCARADTGGFDTPTPRNETVLLPCPILPSPAV